MIQQSQFWVFTQKIWTVCQTDIHTPLSTAALSMAAMQWKSISSLTVERDGVGRTMKYHFTLTREGILFCDPEDAIEESHPK